MKHLLVSALSAFAIPAFAETAIVTGIEPNMFEVLKEVPQTECRDVEVPVYKDVRTGSTEDIVGGAALGGILGGIVTDSKEGAGIGALFGGLLGAQSERVVTGIRITTQCDTTMVTEKANILLNYTVYYEWNGIAGTGTSLIPHEVGDPIEIEVLLVYKD